MTGSNAFVDTLLVVVQWTAFLAAIILAGFILWGGFLLLVPVGIFYAGEKLALYHRVSVTNQVETDTSPTEGEPPWLGDLSGQRDDQQKDL